MFGLWLHLDSIYPFYRQLLVLIFGFVFLLQGVSVSVSVLTLTCISIERWYAICHPLLFRATPQRARLMILVIWAVSLCLIVPDLVVLDTRAKFPGVTVLLTACRPAEWWADTSQAAYQLFLSVAMFLMPFILMFVLYVQIAQTLWSNAIPTETSKCRTFPSVNIRICFIAYMLNIGKLTLSSISDTIDLTQWHGSR